MDYRHPTSEVLEGGIRYRTLKYPESQQSTNFADHYHIRR